jgi:hypothetical protein
MQIFYAKLILAKYIILICFTIRFSGNHFSSEVLPGFFRNYSWDVFYIYWCDLIYVKFCTKFFLFNYLNFWSRRNKILMIHLFILTLSINFIKSLMSWICICKMPVFILGINLVSQRQDKNIILDFHNPYATLLVQTFYGTHKKRNKHYH